MSLFVKRTPSSGPPPGLLFGELAYSDDDQRLYVGRVDTAAPPAIFDSASTDYSAAIAALTTDVTTLETTQGTQAGAIAALALEVDALETSQAGQDSAIAALATEVVATKRSLTATTGTLAYAAIVNLDMAALTCSYQTISLEENLELTTSNRATGREVSIRLLADASSRNLTLPAGWRFLGAARPTSIAANKTAMLTITFFAAADTDALCAYAVEL